MVVNYNKDYIPAFQRMKEEIEDIYGNELDKNVKNIVIIDCKKEKSMIIDIIEYQLKDGRTARIRSPKDEDIQEMLDFLYVSAGETDFLMRCPEECGRYTTESEKQRFDRVNKADNETILLCFVDGKLVGSGQIMWSKRIKTRHRASISVTVLRQFWSQGIAVKLIQELIKIAEKNPDILQIELEICRGEYPGQSLIWKKWDFELPGQAKCDPAERWSFIK